MSRPRLFLALLAGATLILILLILTDVVPYLRGPAPGTSEWYWPYLLRPAERWWAPGAAATVLWLIGGWWLKQEQGSRRLAALTLLLLVAGNLLLQLALVYADRHHVTAELVDRTLSHLSGGYFSEAATTGAIGPLLRNYPAAMPHFVSDHLRTHPPGIFLLNWLAVQVWAAAPGTAVTESLARPVIAARCADLWLLEQPLSVAAALLAVSFLPLLAAALAVLPAYALARRLMPETAARLATLLVATLPALLLFAPQSDQFFPALALTLFYCIHRSVSLVSSQEKTVHSQQSKVKRQTPIAWFFLAGLVLSLMTFLSLGNAALLLPLALWPATTAPNYHLPITDYKLRLARSLFAGMFAFVLGAGSLWLLYWLGWGVAPWEIAQVSLQQHYTIVNQYRRYSWWIFFNLVDLLVYAGPVVITGFLGAALSQSPKINYQLPRSSLTTRRLGLSLLFFLLLLNFSGSTRAEVGRIWLFFMPLLALVSGAYWGRKLPGWRHGGLLVGWQIMVAVAVGLAWQPVRAVIVVPQKPPQPAAEAPAIPVSAHFGQDILLTGYALDQSQARRGGVLQLKLHWQAEGPVARPYTVFTHLVSHEGQLVAQQDNWPVQGQWPPTCWQPGEIVVDPYHIELPADMAAGEYTLYVGLYDARDDSRLPMADGRDALSLHAIRVRP
jgi:4-amino-4-deoxy-L-arabinose transferase-like glycosyltransferase